MTRPLPLDKVCVDCATRDWRSCCTACPHHWTAVPAPRTMRLADISEDWREDSLRWRGRVLTGLSAHWCWDWDGLPIDETCPEWPCC